MSFLLFCYVLTFSKAKSIYSVTHPRLYFKGKKCPLSVSNLLIF